MKKWIKVRNEETPWLPQFVCPVCGEVHEGEDDTCCEHCGAEVGPEWENE